MDLSQIPNVPGLRPNRVDRSSKKRHGFKMVHGVAMEPTPAADPEVMREATESAIAEARSTISLAASLTQAPAMSNSVQWLENAGQVLSFGCYFNEQVHCSADEDYRVRQCELLYYLADDTLQIVEKKSENSGMPQGNFVKRHQVPKDTSADVGGAMVTLDDIEVGQPLTIYEREFFITSCNGSTRRYLEALGREVADAVEAPADPYTTLRADFMSRETGADLDVPRNQLKSPMKKFMEASLGNTVNTTGLEGFLKYSGVVLQFDGAWDDTANLHGDVNQYSVCYFVADDTIEVGEVHTPNDGQDPYPLLVKKMRLPRDFQLPDANGRADEPAEGEYYDWRDLAVGGEIVCFGRKIFLYDADPATRAFYAERGITLAPRQDPGFTPAPAPVEREVPPYNGWGSEADSLAGTKSLIPKAPKTVFDLQGANINRTVLRYEARMITDVADDKIRKLVISYYCADSTLMVSEPPQRNTGIIGGRFLERGSYKKADGTPYAPTDLHVGAEVVINAHRLRVVDVDSFTLGYMEGHPKEFPLSDAPRVLTGVRAMLRQQAATGNVTQVFHKYDEDSSGYITIDEFSSILKHYDPDMPEQAVVTLMRAFDVNSDGKVGINEFRAALDPEGIASGLDGSAADAAYEEKLASMQKASSDEQLAKRVLHSFVNEFMSKGSNSKMVSQLSGSDRSAGDTFTRQAFLDAITVAETAATSDSANINLTPKMAAYVANHFFKDRDELVYSDFLAEVAQISEATAVQRRSSVGVHHAAVVE
eukprot:g804.t1